MSGIQPPIDALSSDDIGGLVIVVCFALAAVSLLVGIVHFSLAVLRSLAFGFDDAAYVIANVGGRSSVSVQLITLTLSPRSLLSPVRYSGDWLSLTDWASISPH